MKKVYFLFLLSLIAKGLFAGDSIKTFLLDNGIQYTFYQKSIGPVELHYLTIDLRNNSISFDVINCSDTIGGPKEKTSEMFERISGSVKVIAGVNGDFFGGSPAEAENITFRSGNIVKGVSLNRSVLGFTKTGLPVIEIFKHHSFILLGIDTIIIDMVNQKNPGDKIIAYNSYYGTYTKTDTNSLELILKKTDNFRNNEIKEYVVSPAKLKNNNKINSDELIISFPDKFNSILKKIKSNNPVLVSLGVLPYRGEIKSMIGGYPRLIHDGRIPESFLTYEGIQSEKFIDKNPRTAVGFNADTTKLFIIVVDGRQKEKSIGMTLPELAKFMKDLGCENAINLDGGGSTTLVIEGKVINSPSDSKGERPVANFLIVTKK